MQKSKINHLANVYNRYKCQLNSIHSGCIVTYIQEINAAYDKILQTGLKVVSVSIECNDFEQFCDGIKHNGVMVISDLHNESLFLSPELNLKFRAVHDYIHYIFNLPFTFDGEVKAYKIQKHFHPSEISRKILYSEVVLQAAYCETYGKFADVQKVIVNF